MDFRCDDVERASALDSPLLTMQAAQSARSGVARWVLFAACLFALGGCATSPAPLVMVDPGGAAGRNHEIVVATSRSPVDEPLQRYGDGRSNTLSLDNVDVWVPANRSPGSVRYPSTKADPDKEFGITRFQSLSGPEFVQHINQRMAEIEEENTVFLFIHGYNVAYANGIYRMAQMAEDFDSNAVPIMFSWPSSGRTLGYLYDRDSVQFARDGLVELITLIETSDADQIFLMGHSMGTMLVMETLRQLSLIGGDEYLKMISPLVLASPDIDIDVFRSQMDSLSHQPEPMVVFVAQDDGALRLSQKIRGGHPRVGEGLNIPELQDMGIAVIDLSDVDLGEGSQHSAFASSPTLISVMKQTTVAKETLTDADQAEQRSPLEAMRDLTSGLLYLPQRAISPSN